MADIAPPNTTSNHLQAQEIWSLVVPMLLLLRTSSDQMTKCTPPAKLLLLSMFCAHYFYRCALCARD